MCQRPKPDSVYYTHTCDVLHLQMLHLSSFHNMVTRVIKVLTDLAADLTQDVLLGTDQRLLKPFFDIPKNRGEATSQS